MNANTPSCSYELFMGLPGTGKTTFLAALWHVVESGEVPDAMRLVRLQGDRDHLNRIRNDWLNCRQLERTLPTAEKTVSVLLSEQDGSNTTELFLPDLSGESFRKQWVNREWSKDFNDFAERAVGVLLFIHPGMVIPPETIGHRTNQMISAVDPDQSSTNREEGEETVSPWKPDETPTQVILVGLLQFLLEGPFASRTLRLAVVISAWDLIMQEKISPTEWLAKRVPLVAQFLRAHSEVCTVRVYGISAQGGALERAEDLRKHIQPSDRLVVVGPGCRARDISEPIRWVMS